MDIVPIDFFSEDVDFSIPAQEKVSEWINQIAGGYEYRIENVSIIFCSDIYLLNLNQKHLGHDYFTDILTFPFHEAGATWLKGDIFISIDRVRENAETMKSSFSDELHRVIIHGILHLIGFNDHSEEEEQQMRTLEDLSLEQRRF